MWIINLLLCQVDRTSFEWVYCCIRTCHKGDISCLFTENSYIFFQLIKRLSTTSTVLSITKHQECRGNTYASFIYKILFKYIYMLFFYNCANCVKFYYFFFYQKHVHSILMKITWSKLISHNIILYSVKSWLVYSLIVFSESAPGEKCINEQPPNQCSVITSECISAMIGGSDYRCICNASYYRDGQECKSCNLFTLQYLRMFVN